jgi:hypothetical protein
VLSQNYTKTVGGGCKSENGKIAAAMSNNNKESLK